MKPRPRTLVVTGALVMTLMTIVGGSAYARSSIDGLPRTRLGDPQQACGSPTSAAPVAATPTMTDSGSGANSAAASASESVAQHAPIRPVDRALPATGNAGLASGASSFVGFGTLQQTCATPAATVIPSALATGTAAGGVGGNFPTGSGSGDFSLPPGSLY